MPSSLAWALIRSLAVRWLKTRVYSALVRSVVAEAAPESEGVVEKT